MAPGLKSLAKILIPDKYLLCKIRPEYNAVALTFDDGPCAPQTEKILDILKSEDATATFFLIGREVRRYPAIARRVRQEGHGIGLHTYTHANFSHMNVRQMREEIGESRRAVEEVVGISPRILRSPEGVITPKLLWCALREGVTLVHWSADIRDSFVGSKEELLARMGALKVSRGDVLLLHDDADYTPDALPEIIRALKEGGFSFTTVL
jgi:peptidoglycan/xylan/chitin deacetylase (PgdA/CDA1 family)